MESSERRVVPVSEEFFCDGAWYVLTSNSLGGSGLSPGELADRLQSQDPGAVAGLAREGICLPLYFPGDCALDAAVIVIGDLDETEEREWIGRLRSRLRVRCGTLVLVGGGIDEDLENALVDADPETLVDPDGGFQRVKLDPGDYLVEIYAFLGSLTANFAWEELPEDAEPMGDWWARTRPGEEPAGWIASFAEEDYVDSEEFELVEYLIRIAPFREDDGIPVPGQDEAVHWCGVFETRRPDPCPVGIRRDRYPEG